MTVVLTIASAVLPNYQFSYKQNVTKANIMLLNLLFLRLSLKRIFWFLCSRWYSFITFESLL